MEMIESAKGFLLFRSLLNQSGGFSRGISKRVTWKPSQRGHGYVDFKDSLNEGCNLKGH